jgi:hypothetical protein
MNEIEFFQLKGTRANKARFGFAKGWCHWQPKVGAPKPLSLFERTCRNRKRSGYRP